MPAHESDMSFPPFLALHSTLEINAKEGLQVLRGSIKILERDASTSFCIRALGRPDAAALTPESIETRNTVLQGILYQVLTERRVIKSVGKIQLFTDQLEILCKYLKRVVTAAVRTKSKYTVKGVL